MKCACCGLPVGPDEEAAACGHRFCDICLMRRHDRPCTICHPWKAPSKQSLDG